MSKQTHNLRIPPQNLEAEMAVLGVVMLRPTALFDIGDLLSPESFYSTRHRLIYQAMLELSTKGQPIDMVSLTHLLTEKKQLELSGGASYLAEVTSMVPAAANLLHYANIVHKKFLLRSLVISADEIATMAFEENDDKIFDVLDAAEKKIFGVTSSTQGQKFINIKNTLGEVWEHIERLHESTGEIRGVPTGFKGLDDMLSGLQNSDLIILAARPSVGKTTLALDIARNAATKHNIPVGIFSLEMSAQQLANRLVSAESRVDAWKIRTGQGLTDTHFDSLREAMDRLAKAPIFIDDKAANSITQMRSVARRLKSEHGLGLIVIDYLQLMTTSKNYDSMVNQVTEISRSLKALARELNVPVLALSQLSRAVEARGGKPRLSDLRDSGSIEQDADVVMFIHREDKYKEESERNNIAEILIEKHRNGATGKVDLFFDGKTTSFLPLEKSSMDDFVASAPSASNGSYGDMF